MTDVDKIKNAVEHSEMIHEQAYNHMLQIHNHGTKFIHELIRKEIEYKNQLSKNLDQYQNSGDVENYRSTFSSWNKLNLVIFDLKDILCRMGEDID